MEAKSISLTAKEIYQTIKERPYKDGEALIKKYAEEYAKFITMQTINYHGWTVNTEPTPHPLTGKPEYVATNDGKVLPYESLEELLDLIYERTYNLTTN